MPVEYHQLLDLRRQAKVAGDWTVESVCTLALSQIRRGMRDTPAIQYCAEWLAKPTDERWD